MTIFLCTFARYLSSFTMLKLEYQYGETAVSL